jgi:hypothetical protein
MKYILLLIALICIPISCTNEDNYSQLQEWRTELRVEIVEARRNINSTSDLTLRSVIYVNEVIGFYVWLKNNLAEPYVDNTCDDELFVNNIKSQLEPVSLLIQISPPEEDPFELFPLPSEIIHILGAEGSVGLEKDEFNLLDSNNLEWKIPFVDSPLKLEKKDVWYIVPTRLTESIFKGCKK